MQAVHTVHVGVLVGEIMNLIIRAIIDREYHTIYGSSVTSEINALYTDLQLISSS